MLRVGLTGGLASGKSLVGRELAALGCHLIQADDLGHEALLPTGDAHGPAVREFGDAILNNDGKIDRRKLAAIVFSDAAKLAKLSAMVHPAVVRREEEITTEIAKTEPDAIVVVEAAILVETGSYRKFDRLIVAACRPEQQLERAMHRDTYSQEEVLARLARQLPWEEKKRVAHYVIDTSGGKEDALQQTREVYRSLRELQK